MGAAVALVLIVVAVASLAGDDDEGGGNPTAAPAATASPVEAVCARNRRALEGVLPLVGDISMRVAAAQTPTELTALASEADQIAAQALADLRSLQAQITETAVPADQVEDRDALVVAMGKVVFSMAAFASRSVEVVASGDPAAVRAYTAEATESLTALDALYQEVAVAARALGAPSCSIQGTSATPPTGPPAPRSETVPPPP